MENIDYGLPPIAYEDLSEEAIEIIRKISTEIKKPEEIDPVFFSLVATIQRNNYIISFFAELTKDQLLAFMAEPPIVVKADDDEESKRIEGNIEITSRPIGKLLANWQLPYHNTNAFFNIAALYKTPDNQIIPCGDIDRAYRELVDILTRHSEIIQGATAPGLSLSPVRVFNNTKAQTQLPEMVRKAIESAPEDEIGGDISLPSFYEYKDETKEKVIGYHNLYLPRGDKNSLPLMDGGNLIIPQQISEFEMQVLDVISSMCAHYTISRQLPMIFTARDVYREANHLSGNIKTDFSTLKPYQEAILSLWNRQFYIDKVFFVKDKNGEEKKVTKTTIDKSNTLLNIVCDIVRIEENGRTVEKIDNSTLLVFSLKTRPVLLQYAEELKQIVSAPANLLSYTGNKQLAPRNNSKDRTLIKNYLLREVMKTYHPTHPRDCRIRYNTLFKDCGIETAIKQDSIQLDNKEIAEIEAAAPTPAIAEQMKEEARQKKIYTAKESVRKQLRRLRVYIGEILTDWKGILIADLKEYTLATDKGKAATGVEITKLNKKPDNDSIAQMTDEELAKINKEWIEKLKKKK